MFTISVRFKKFKEYVFIEIKFSFILLISCSVLLLRKH